ncbi:CotO family spore coat protein [Domibacillus sp. DTU_2020_1001157_1_SI_ALB_TIR_016]|uniref:CotO family spore coat protein n=1 Tax=Domibacillus sp. DTU_2020_1001157_1_SI_ALB_TIR_016 TaxID=3077789 RepID=UPI0028EB7E9A|nr:CotO family spore coat protein [Domibacillus sp. DTU_2020_1001157_1_SI_ALB_TIR_016]WNS80036.1 CotO family spore coat protein [Domibacillus sp. DTU_2020_1001157_1_SI_ALB_TIR_016]
MKKTPGPLLYIGQPHLTPIQPVMQKIAKAESEGEIIEEVKQEAEEKQLTPPVQKKEEKSGDGRLKPFREMSITEKVVYLAERRIPVPCRFEWSGPTVRGVIQSFDETYVWILDEESDTPVQVPITDIGYIRLAGT